MRGLKRELDEVENIKNYLIIAPMPSNSSYKNRLTWCKLCHHHHLKNAHKEWTRGDQKPVEKKTRVQVRTKNSHCLGLYQNVCCRRRRGGLISLNHYHQQTKFMHLNVCTK